MIIFKLYFVDIPGNSFRFDSIEVGIIHQFALEIVVAAAFQASGSFFHGLFRSISENDFCKVVFSFFRMKVLHSGSALSLPVLKSLFGDIGSFYAVTLFVLDDFTIQISVYDGCRFLGISDGFNGNGNLVVSTVTTGKYTGDAGHKGVRIIGDTVFPGFVHSVKSGWINGLTNSQDSCINIDGLCFAFYRLRSSSSGSIRFTQFHNLQYDLFYTSVFSGNELDGVGQIFEDYPFFIGFDDFDLISRHFILGSSVNVIYFLGSQTNCGTAGVHGSVTTAYDGNIITETDFFVSDYLSQEIDSADNSRQVLTLTSYASGNPGTNAKQNCIVIFPNRGERNVNADFGVGNQVNAHFFQKHNFIVNDFLGQPVFGDSVTKHTTQLGHGFINGDIMSHGFQEIGCGYAQRATADDSDALSGGRSHIRHEPVIGIEILVCCKPLQPLNGDGFVNQAPSALLFAGMGTYSAQGSGHRNLISNQLQGCIKLAVGNQANITLTVGLSRASQGTGRSTVPHVVG